MRYHASNNWRFWSYVINEQTLSSFDGRVPNIVLISGDFFSSSLETLLTLSCPACPIYEAGKKLLRFVLSSASVYYSSTNATLEAAYAWTLSVRSYMDSDITFFDSAPDLR